MMKLLMIIFLSSSFALADQKIGYITKTDLGNSPAEIQAELNLLTQPSVKISQIQPTPVYPAGCDEYDCSPIKTICLAKIGIELGTLSIAVPTKNLS